MAKDSYPFAIIAGTGVSQLFSSEQNPSISLQSEFGEFQCEEISIQGHVGVLAQRHSFGHKVPPHLVNYRALMQGLKNAGIGYCVASAAVGSLRTDWSPGTLAICSAFLDFSGRNLTLFDREVSHTDMSDAFGTRPRKLEMAAKECSIQVEPEATYVLANGPRYESPAEIRAFRILGGDVVGMTAASEAILAREAGINYECLAAITNLGAGLKQQTLEHGEVTEVMTELGPKLKRLFEAAVLLSLK